MSNFASGYIKYINHLEQINDAAVKNPLQMINEVEGSFHDNIKNIARNIFENHRGVKIIMLSGPSSSGKTTTANLLRTYLREFGLIAYTISMDDFFKGLKNTPVLPNGRYDFESLNALRTDKVTDALKGILEKGECSIPKFNFEKSSPEGEERLLRLEGDDLIIMEGIHALNPFFTQKLDPLRVMKLYVSVKQSLKDANGVVMSPLDIRAVRRIVRDANFRGTTTEKTLAMWPEVVEGETLYIRPYRMSADYTVNSAHIYEPCVFRAYAIPMLREIAQDSPHYRKARDLESRLMRFEPVSGELVPQNSILREFIG